PRPGRCRRPPDEGRRRDPGRAARGLPLSRPRPTAQRPSRRRPRLALLRQRHHLVPTRRSPHARRPRPTAESRRFGDTILISDRRPDAAGALAPAAAALPGNTYCVPEFFSAVAEPRTAATSADGAEPGGGAAR